VVNETDYIFTANFIVRTDLEKDPKEESPANPKDAPKAKSKSKANGETKAKLSW